MIDFRNEAAKRNRRSWSLFGKCRVCDISGGDKPRLSLPSGGNLDFPNRLSLLNGKRENPLNFGIHLRNPHPGTSDQ